VANTTRKQIASQKADPALVRAIDSPVMTGIGRSRTVPKAKESVVA
jgi:hypothetical protein